MQFVKVSRRLMFIASLLLGSQAFAADSYSFGVVPQQSAIHTLETWGPIVEKLSQQTGKKIILKTSPDIVTFQKQLSEGAFDFAYMNPHHYISFHDKSGYNALTKAKDKRIKGILVVSKDSPINSVAQLKGMPVAFPKGAFAADIMPNAWLKQQGIEVDAHYVGSHEEGYKKVSQGMYMASGGVMRTFKAGDEITRGTLKVLWTSDGYTPHAIAVHPRVPAADSSAVQQALVALADDAEGQAMVKALKLKGFEAAQDSDWNDVRALNLPPLQ